MRMNEFFNNMLANLLNMAYAMGIFLCAYLSNMAFGLYHNVKQLGQPFERDRLINSGWKVLSVVLGLTFLVVAATALPNFATLVGWEIPAEYTDVLSNIAVIGVCLLASCKYIKEAATKFTEILNEPKNVEDL